MKVEIMIYAYLAICFSMIVFNCVCIFVFRRRDKRISKRSENLEERVTRQIEELLDGGEVTDEHKKYLRKRLKKSGNLLAFDETLERLSVSNPQGIRTYLTAIYPVFVYLATEYLKKEETLATFYLYILRKYQVLRDMPMGIMNEIVLELVRYPGIYCRENALQVIYSGGDADLVVAALKSLDDLRVYHHGKLIYDGLLTFTGDRRRLDEKLWEEYDGFSLDMKLNLLNYFRFSSDGHGDRMFCLLKNENENDEVRFSCIRYFGKYKYPMAYPLLLDLADSRKVSRWEYSAIASSALANYPDPQTTAVLKDNLHSTYWHIRFNAAQSLEQLGFDYSDMIDIFEGDDRYAREMLQYRLDLRNTREEEYLCRTV